MKKINAIAMILGILFGCHFTFAVNMATVCTTNNRLTDDAFLEQFPYQDYLQQNLAAPLKSMIENRAILKAQGRGAVVDDICFETMEYYLKAHPVDVTQLDLLQSQLRTAEEFLKLDGATDSALTMMAHQIGDRFFSAAAYGVEEGYASGALDKHSADFQEVLEILRRNQFNPNISKSSAEKLLLNAQNGNWSYIWDRFKTRYLKDTLFLMSIGINAIFMLGFLKGRLKKRKEKQLTIDN